MKEIAEYILAETDFFKKVEYVYYLKNKLEPGAVSTLFDGVTIPAEFTLSEMVHLDSFTLKVTVCSPAPSVTSSLEEIILPAMEA